MGGCSRNSDLILLIFLIAGTFQIGTASGETNSSDNGDQSEITGKLTTIDNFPFMAHIRRSPQVGGELNFCGGILIKSSLVLTAAQCVHKIEGALFVYMGVNNLVQLGENLLVQKRKVIDHEVQIQYVYNKDCNVAMLMLDNPFTVTARVKPTDVLTEWRDFSNAQCLTIGWATANYSKNPNELHVGSTRVWEDNKINCLSKCLARICTKNLIVGVPTQGNIGSPLIYKGTVIGMCTAVNNQDKIAYEDLSNYKWFIRDIVSKASHDSREWNTSKCIVFLLLFGYFGML